MKAVLNWKSRGKQIETDGFFTDMRLTTPF
jgi:hypothetical protein